MIAYTKEARDSYIETIERLQAELGSVPTNIIDYTDLHWLIHTALDDLKKTVINEQKYEDNRCRIRHANYRR